MIITASEDKLDFPLRVFNNLIKLCFGAVWHPCFSKDDSLNAHFHLITQTPATSNLSSPAEQAWACLTKPMSENRLND